MQNELSKVQLIKSFIIIFLMSLSLSLQGQTPFDVILKNEVQKFNKQYNKYRSNPRELVWKSSLSRKDKRILKNTLSYYEIKELPEMKVNGNVISFYLEEFGEAQLELVDVRRNIVAVNGVHIFYHPKKSFEKRFAPIIDAVNPKIDFVRYKRKNIKIPFINYAWAQEGAEGVSAEPKKGGLLKPVKDSPIVKGVKSGIDKAKGLKTKLFGDKTKIQKSNIGTAELEFKQDVSKFRKKTLPANWNPMKFFYSEADYLQLYRKEVNGINKEYKNLIDQYNTGKNLTQEQKTDLKKQQVALEKRLDAATEKIKKLKKYPEAMREHIQVSDEMKNNRQREAIRLLQQTGAKAVPKGDIVSVRNQQIHAVGTLNLIEGRMAKLQVLREGVQEQISNLKGSKGELAESNAKEITKLEKKIQKIDKNIGSLNGDRAAMLDLKPRYLAELEKVKNAYNEATGKINTNRLNAEKKIISEFEKSSKGASPERARALELQRDKNLAELESKYEKEKKRTSDKFERRKAVLKGKFKVKSGIKQLIVTSKVKLQNIIDKYSDRSRQTFNNTVQKLKVDKALSTVSAKVQQVRSHSAYRWVADSGAAKYAQDVGQRGLSGIKRAGGKVYQVAGNHKGILLSIPVFLMVDEVAKMMTASGDVNKANYTFNDEMAKSLKNQLGNCRENTKGNYAENYIIYNPGATPSIDQKFYKTVEGYERSTYQYYESLACNLPITQFQEKFPKVEITKRTQFCDMTVELAKCVRTIAKKLETARKSVVETSRKAGKLKVEDKKDKKGTGASTGER